jgi:Na+-transporting methylmalonyl-CoA/oxaloacetate decarboxylase gamma subunit
MNRSGRLRVVGRGAAGAPQRNVFRKRRPAQRPRLLLEGMLLLAAGVGLLVLLLQLPRLVDLDSLLLVSTAIAHLIGGLSQLLLGLLQLLGVLLLAALALLALVLLVAGLLRLVRALLGPPRPAGKPSLKAAPLNRRAP